MLEDFLKAKSAEEVIKNLEKPMERVKFVLEYRPELLDKILENIPDRFLPLCTFSTLVDYIQDKKTLEKLFPKLMEDESTMLVILTMQGKSDLVRYLIDEKGCTEVPDNFVYEMALNIHGKDMFWVTKYIKQKSKR